MIQFALLFGLGFFSAVLLVMIVAPAVHRRIVRYTENRIKATMPISPAEVRAQRDMARAVYAAENARTKQELTQERDRLVKLQLAHDKLSTEAAELQAVNQDLLMQMDGTGIEAADLRARLRREETHIQQLRQTLHSVEETSAAKDVELETLRKRLMKLMSDVDNLNIDISTRDTEVENLKFRSNALRVERDTLATDVKLLTARAKDAENRLTQEEHKTYRLEDKLAREIAAKTDRDATIGRRNQEIERLRDKLKTVTTELRGLQRGKRPTSTLVDAERELESAEDLSQAEQPTNPSASLLQIPAQREESAMPDLAALSDDIRNRATALGAQLGRSKSKASEEALRREMASIAADMIALTALKEGATSPIPALLADAPSNTSERLSLSKRAKDSLAALSGHIDAKA